jgi:transcriptional regulator with XRE-family HTH domain
MDIYELIGRKIKSARKEENVGQKILAYALRCSPACISHYEKNKREISLIDLQKIADILLKPLSYFFSEDGESKASAQEFERLSRKLQAKTKKISRLKEENAFLSAEYTKLRKKTKGIKNRSSKQPGKQDEKKTWLSKITKHLIRRYPPTLS